MCLPVHLLILGIRVSLRHLLRIKTLSYFKDMGVTHLQLMPSYDFASIDESDSLKEQYNWGYDPYNYNVPEALTRQIRLMEP